MTSPTNYTGDSYGLLVGALRGYRVWDLQRVPQGNVLLHSLNKEQWEGPELEARCRGGVGGYTLNHGKSPVKACTCGLYACHEPNSDFNVLTTTYRVSGVVEGTGRVVVGDRGFRSEKMRIVAVARPLACGRRDYEIRDIQFERDGYFDSRARQYGYPLSSVSIYTARAETRLATGQSLSLSFQFTEEMLIASKLQPMELAVKSIHDYMDRFFASQPPEDEIAARLAEHYRVEMFETFAELLKAYPPISVKHLLPTPKPPLAPNPPNPNQFMWRTNSGVLGLGGGQIASVVPYSSSVTWGPPNIGSSIVNFGALQESLRAAASASAAGMAELTKAVENYYSMLKVEKKPPVTTAIAFDTEPIEKPAKPSWKNKIPKRWRGK